MGRRKRRTREKQRDPTTEKTESYTLPPSPSHSSSSSSSDFEFSISISPRKSSTLLCPADELFYKGQLLPLHLSPRISMVRTLLLSSPPSNYSAPRDSTASTTSSSSSFITNDCDSSRPSSATDDENHFINRHNHHHISNNNAFNCNKATTTTTNSNNNRYFSFSRFSSVFRKPRGETESVSVSESSSSVKRMGNTAKEVIRKCLKKVKKPLSGKFSQKQQKTVSSLKTERSRNETGVCSVKNKKEEITESDNSAMVSSSSSSYSFSGNLKYPRRRNNNYVSSCPSSMISSPTRSGVLSRSCYSDSSTMEELQNAIQGAITHCKNSLVQNNKTVVSSEI